jgi:hypothetical protein
MMVDLDRSRAVWFIISMITYTYCCLDNSKVRIANRGVHGSGWPQDWLRLDQRTDDPTWPAGHSGSSEQRYKRPLKQFNFSSDSRVCMSATQAIIPAFTFDHVTRNSLASAKWVARCCTASWCLPYRREIAQQFAQCKTYWLYEGDSNDTQTVQSCAKPMKALSRYDRTINCSWHDDNAERSQRSVTEFTFPSYN